MKTDSERRALARKFLKLQDELERLQEQHNAVRSQLIKEGSFRAGPYAVEVRSGSRRHVSVRLIELKHPALFKKLLTLGLVNLIEYPTISVERRLK